MWGGPFPPTAVRARGTSLPASDGTAPRVLPVSCGDIGARMIYEGPKTPPKPPPRRLRKGQARGKLTVAGMLGLGLSALVHDPQRPLR